MHGDHACALLDCVANIIHRFGMANLEPVLRVCSTLRGDQTPLEVAVLGQFKSGKSSLLNALVGSDLLPGGVVPITAVVTRLCTGPELTARSQIWTDGNDRAGEAVRRLRGQQLASEQLHLPDKPAGVDGK